MGFSADYTKQILCFKDFEQKPFRDLCFMLQMKELETSKSIPVKHLFKTLPNINSKTPKELKKVQTHQRLGDYAEYLLQYAIETYSEWELERHSIQAIKHKQTLGEADFLIKKAAQLTHLEFTCKFYIETPDNHIWVGPNTNDSWKTKKAKLEQQQSTLINRHLSQFGLQKQVEEKILALGRIFKFCNGDNLTPFFAVKESQAKTLEKFGQCFQIITDKKDWFYPFFLEGQTFNKIHLLSKIKILQPLKICIYNKKKIPIAVGFIVKENWPN